MLNLTQKYKLASLPFFVQATKMSLIGLATDITHERPEELAFGTAQAAVEAAGVLESAQLTMHTKRRLYALQVARQPDALAHQAATAVASRIIEESTKVSAEVAAVLELYILFLIGDGALPLYDEETTPEAPTIEVYEGIFYSTIEAIIFNGFSALAGYNAHVDPFTGG